MINKSYFICKKCGCLEFLPDPKEINYCPLCEPKGHKYKMQVLKLDKINQTYDNHN
jgi:rubrerythrin